MLKNINPLLGPELLKVLRAMGHGDEIAIVDGNYPADTDAKRLVRMDGHSTTSILDAILSVMPLDDMVPDCAFRPAAKNDPKNMQPVFAEFEEIVKKHEPTRHLTRWRRVQARPATPPARPGGCFPAGSLTALAQGIPFLPEPFEDDRSVLSRVFAGWDKSVPIAVLSGTWRITETYVPDGADLYVLGSTSYDESSGAASFAKAKDRPLYVYCGTEAQLTTNTRRIMYVSTFAMLALAYVSVAIFFGSTYEKAGGKTGIHPAWSRGPIGPTAVLMGMFAVQIIRIRNRIVMVREQRAAGRRLVGIAEKKRATLLPQLTAVVQAAAAHEEGLQTSLAAFRGADVDPTSLTALREASPTLRADANFRQLQEALVSVENDIAVARGFEAEAGVVLRTRVQSFPDSLVAPWLGINVDG